MSKTQSAQTEPHDDRWHYLDSRDEKHRENYVEWKYFNFVQEDLAGYIIYYIADPEKKTKFGGGRLLIRILKDGKSYGLIKKIDMDRVEFDTVSASLRMGGAKIIEHDSYHYELSCKEADIAWSLHYTQRAPSIDSLQNFHTGIMRWEKVNWLIKMPRAEVKGEIKIGENIFKINALGYSDTNWGTWMPFFFTDYEWGQCNAKSFSIVFFVSRKLGKTKSAFAYFNVGEHLISLENAEGQVEHTAWKKDAAGGLKIPSRTNFQIAKDGYEVKVSTRLLYDDSPGLRIYPLLPKVIISEQIAEYEGTILKDGKIIYEFKGRGFQEWSAKTWKEPQVSF